MELAGAFPDVVVGCVRGVEQIRRRIERIVAGTERPRRDKSRQRSWRIPRTIQTPQHDPV
jgi:hypothetical protein